MALVMAAWLHALTIRNVLVLKSLNVKCDIEIERASSIRPMISKKKKSHG